MARRRDPRISQIVRTVNDELKDRAIRHAIYLEGLKTSEVNKIVRFLDREMIPDILDQTRRRLSKGLGTRRLNDLLASVDSTIRVGARKVSGQLKEDLKGLALSEAQWQAKVLTEVVPIEASFVTPSGPLLRSIVTSKPFEGQILSQSVNTWGKAAIRDTHKQIRLGMAQGESIDKIVRRVRGAAKQTRRNAAAVVRTAVNHISAEARNTTFAENEDIIKGVQFVATLDDRTTLICMSLDGKVFPINEGPRPPMHYQCRSTVTPVVKGLEEMGFSRKEIREFPASTRASMNGQVSDKLSYPDWLKQQPKGFQDSVLGPRRADLFRSGKVTIDKMVSPNFQVRDLAELRRLEGLD